MGGELALLDHVHQRLDQRLIGGRHDQQVVLPAVRDRLAGERTSDRLPITLGPVRKVVLGGGFTLGDIERHSASGSVVAVLVSVIKVDALTVGIAVVHHAHPGLDSGDCRVSDGFMRLWDH